MPSAPERYVDWINQHVGFNPRGQGHSDFLTSQIFEDLDARCPTIDQHFRDNRLRLVPNVGTTGKRHVSPLAAAAKENGDDDEINPNIDGVVLQVAPFGDVAAARAVITLENKTIMTAHGKARTNRFNDARAYATHVHSSSAATIAAFTVVVNASPTYKNPDAFARAALSSGINQPGAIEGTFRVFESMRLRETTTGNVGRCEAVYILPVHYDGLSATARLVTGPPAPAASSPFGYDSFLERICRLYRERFG